MITDVERKITERYFTAFNSLLASGEIRSVLQFTRLHNINRWGFSALKAGKFNARGSVPLRWLVVLVDHYAISARWLLTGKGAMAKKKPTTK